MVAMSDIDGGPQHSAQPRKNYHDAYTLLGVDKRATTEEIETAYEVEMVEHHNSDDKMRYSVTAALSDQKVQQFR
jgi:DnaJ-class molecular chaperone